MEESSTRHFYDQLAADYHLMFPDWDASMTRQAAALDGLIRGRLGPGPRAVLDCACGIGTQAIGLAARGHRVTGTDLSPVAAARARREATRRGHRLPAAAADMRALPFRSGSFEVLVCADNSLPHLLTPGDVRSALDDMRRVLSDGGLLLVSTRPYDQLRAARPQSAPPQVSHTSLGRTITFQLWHWQDDGEHYDFEHFQLVSDGDSWDVRVRRTGYWALTRDQLTGLVAAAGFTGIEWHDPAASGFFQPVLAARARRGAED